MNEITVDEPSVSSATLEHVLGTGDISKLTVPQRVEFYRATCRSLGLNPLTRPIRFLSFQGQMQAYFTRDGTDQLRKNNKITLHVTDKHADGDVYIITVRARTPDGREDEDIGAVTLGRLTGDSRANALMRCLTKAKRRVTLSICGLGWTSEDELDTMPGARVFDAEDDVPVAPIRTARDALNDTIQLRSAAAATPRAPRKADPVVYETGIDADDMPDPLDETDGSQWLRNLDVALANAQSQDEVVAIGGHASVGHATANAPEHIKRRVSELLAKAFARFAPDGDDDLDEVAIAGEHNLASG